MSNFMYEKGMELDHRLEKVMETHETKVSSTPMVSGLQAFVERQTIAEEIAAIDVSKVAHVDLTEEIVREQIDNILDLRQSKLAAFNELLKATEG